MRISVAMCTYNGALYLRKQLDSIAVQTWQPFELVICDDGSADDTLDLIGEFASRSPFPVRVCRNERNLGITKNFEQAIGLCRGDLIALCDQDDEWYSDKLERMHDLFERFPDALAAFTDADIVDEDSGPTGRKLWRSLKFSPAIKSPHVDKSMVSTLLRLDYIATGATMMLRAELRKLLFPIPQPWIHDAWIAWIAAIHGGLCPMSATTIRYRAHRGQQIGVAPDSMLERFALARQHNARTCSLVAARLASLRSYLQETGDPALARFLPDLDKKIVYMQFRASLPRSVFRRAKRVFLSWREYQQFNRGTLAMIYDSLVTPLDPTPNEMT